MIELVAILLKVVQSILVSTPVVKPDAVPRENIVPLTESPLVTPMLLVILILLPILLLILFQPI